MELEVNDSRLNRCMVKSILKIIWMAQVEDVQGVVALNDSNNNG
jgi:hypothetical protein